MIEITGKYGIIMTSVIYNYGSYDDLEAWEWIYQEGITSANGDSEIELLVKDLPDYFRVHFHLVSWDDLKDDSDPIWVENGEGFARGYGTAVSFDSGNPCAAVGCLIRLAYDSENNLFVVVWADTNGDGKVRAGSIDSGGVVTLGGTTYEWADNTNGIKYFDVDFDQGDSAGEEAFVIVWRTEGGSDDSYGFYIVGTVSGTAITLGTAAEIVDGDEEVHYVSLADVEGDDRIILCYGINNGGGDGGKCSVGAVTHADGTVDARTVSWGSGVCFTPECDTSGYGIKWVDIVYTAGTDTVSYTHLTLPTKA